MPDQAMSSQPAPETDPTSIFEHYRGSYGSELLCAALAHFDVFERLRPGPMPAEAFGRELGLAARPMTVLTTALRAMGLIQMNWRRHLALTPLASEHLTRDAPFFVGDYVGLTSSSPGVLEMVERLRSNQPAGLDQDGAAFIYRRGIRSAMKDRDLARHFTLALAGRAKNVAPVLAKKVAMSGVDCLLDVGAGTGIYSIAFLKRFPSLRVVALDLPEVNLIARDFARDHQVEDRIEFIDGDMFERNDFPPMQAVLLSNILYDWDVPDCRRLVSKYAELLPPNGRLIIHDVFLDDAMDGPLPVALYSAALFSFTQGRAYSGAEFREWLIHARLLPEGPTPTLIHCAALIGRKGQ